MALYKNRLLSLTHDKSEAIFVKNIVFYTNILSYRIIP